jgi:Putative prokaryotic signal transducing protein
MQPMDDDRLVQVFATADPVAGEMMRGRLEAEGVSAMVKGDGEGPYRAGAVYVWVPAEDETVARAVVEAVGSGAFALDEGFEEPADLGVEPAGSAERDE